MDSFDPKNLKKIAVYTSGGDAPGMNAAIRSVVRTAIHHGLEVVGSENGYAGFINNQFVNLERGSVANIIQRGGTILKSGRCKEFYEAEGRKKAAQNIKAANIDALVCIGGDGSFKGAYNLWKEHQIPVVGVPGTIDNDINGTEYTVGFDTAVNTALQSIDKIRDTAASHDKIFIVEVMGRNTGYIAVEVGLSAGAEAVFFPENPFDLEKTVEQLNRTASRGKLSSILITAEGDKPGVAYEMAKQITDKSGHDVKVCILGHIQRGGTPTALDRLIASRFSAKAVEVLLKGNCNCMIGLKGTSYHLVSLDETQTKKEFTYDEILKLTHVLSQ